MTTTTETNDKKNSSVSKGIPYGFMKPPADLQSAITGLRTVESKLIATREGIKSQMAKFYKSFKAKCPVSTVADFARQFDEDVPFTAKSTDAGPGYKTNPTYLALDNMFRYMPDIKTRKAKKDPKAAKAERKAKLRAAENKRTAWQRLLVAVCSQIGLVPQLLTIGFEKAGIDAAAIETAWKAPHSLFDCGLKDFVLVLRNGKHAGLPAAKVIASRTVAAQIAKQVPTQAEVQSQAKSGPTVTVERTPLKHGLMERKVIVLKEGDNVSGMSV